MPEQQVISSKGCTIDRPVMVRSLRRRLWKAIQEEDVETAMRTYTVTLSEYGKWIREEADEEELLQKVAEQRKSQALKERHEARPAAIRRLSSISKSTRRSLLSKDDRRKAMAPTLAETRKNLFCTPPMPSSKYDKSQAILQQLLHPNDPFERDDFFDVFDSYDPQLLLPPKEPSNKEKKTKQKPQRARLAGALFWRSSNAQYELDSSKDFSDKPEDKVDETMTTLLHEACRLGNANFVRLLLANDGNANFKNGMQRTALHMITGGLTLKEQSTEPADVGIRVPVVPKPELGSDDDSKTNSQQLKKVAVKAMSKLFSKFKDGSVENVHLVEESAPFRSSSKDTDYSAQTSARMDTLLSILSWQHPQDGTSAAGDGPSLNSVDSRGRTALHYCAELGRADLSLAILTSFGAILTIVDEMGQTPCELAAEQAHQSLAAQLEARALLYTDPYGMDEELMANVRLGTPANSESDGEDHQNPSKKKRKHALRQLVAPFSLHETWRTTEQITEERNERTMKVLVEMQSILQSKQTEKESSEMLMNHGLEDSMDVDEEATVNSERAVDGAAAKDDENDEDDAEDEDEKYSKASEKDATEKGEADISKPKSEETDAEKPAADGEVTEEEKKPAANGETHEKEKKHAKKDKKVETEKESKKKEKKSESKKLKETDQKKQAADEDAAQSAKKEISSEVEDITPIENPKGEMGQVMSEYQFLLGLLTEAHAERYVAYHFWSKSAALKEFRGDPMKAINEAGISTSDYDDILGVGDRNEEAKAEEKASMCLICCNEFEPASEKWAQLSNCDHGFCKECLGDYISECARTKETGTCIDCPHHECNKPLTCDEIKSSSPTDHIYDSLIAAADENFVAVADDLCFCPHPNCGSVVRRRMPRKLLNSKIDNDLINLYGAVCVATGIDDEDAPMTYEGVRDPNYKRTKNTVNPVKAHRFCFSCGSKTIHWPIPCDMLEKWKENIRKEIGELEEDEDGEGSGDNFDDVAQRLWMKANTRPCPKCKAPIEKNDGCNHMTCSNRNCKHEFCWICREDWKLHNTETGGFFRCNKWQEDENHDYYDTPPPPEQRTPSPAAAAAAAAEPSAVALAALAGGESLQSENNYGTALHSARVAWKRSKEMGRFLHHYRRWTAHSESAALERKMAELSCIRLAAVVEAAIDFNGQEDFDFGGKGLSFVHNAFAELLECRSLLQHSYAFAFFRYPTQYHVRRSRQAKQKEREKLEFEQLQSELEMLTEQLSDIVARKHLRATQNQIMFLTAHTAQKRTGLSQSMLTLLHEHRKDMKEAAEEAKQEKKKPAVDRNPYDMPSPFLLHMRGGEHLSSNIHRHMESLYYRTRYFMPNDSESDEDDFMMMHLGRHRFDDLGRQRFDRHGDDGVLNDTARLSNTMFGRHGIHELVGMDPDEPRFQDWACGACTYMNHGGRRCAMCGSPRQ